MRSERVICGIGWRTVLGGYAFILTQLHQQNGCPKPVGRQVAQTTRSSQWGIRKADQRGGKGRRAFAPSLLTDGLGG